VSAVRAALAAPVSGRTWRELAATAVRVLLGLPAFLLALLGLVAAPLSLLGVGLPVLAGTLALARRAPVVFRGPARRLLGWDWAAPPPLPAGGPARRLRALFGDETAWRALLYCFLVLPLAVAGTYLAVVAVVVGTAAVTSPAWSLVVPESWRSWTGGTWGGSWLLAAQGAAVLLVFPWLVRGLVLLDRALVGGLLTPGRAGRRIAELETSRAVVSADAAATLRRLERDLHDGTQARLVTIGLLLSRLEQREADPVRRTELGAAREMVSEGLVELREVIRGMHPPALDDGLPTALATLAARSAVPTEFRDRLESRPAEAVASTLYFSAAELLTNVARHAGASAACLSLTEDDGRVVLTVTDDGRGGARVRSGGTGLAGLRRRAEALDGSLTVDSRDGGPTTVTVTLPGG
jgi:signal transduction histidine kinase